jgi:hypothetical protein
MSRCDANQEQAMESISLLVSKQRSRLADFVTLAKSGVMMLAVSTAIVALTIAPGDLAPLRARHPRGGPGRRRLAVDHGRPCHGAERRTQKASVLPHP